MKLRPLIALGATGFVSGLLLLAPAAILHGWFKPKLQPAPFELFGLHGTLDEGGMAALQFNGRPGLNDLRWHFHPLWLLLARAAFDIEGGGDLALVEGNLSVTPFGTLRLSDFRATGALKPLMAAAGQSYVPVDGQVRFDLRKLKLRHGQPQSAEGVVQIQQLAWTLARDPLMLGDYQATLTTEGSDILAKIESTSGPLELSGDGKFAVDQSYEATLKLRLKADASPMLRNLVGGAGQPDPQGYYTVHYAGKLQ